MSAHNKAISYAVIQLGYCVFGVGATEDAAIIDAAEWMEGNDGENLDPDMVRDLIVRIHNAVDGDMVVMGSAHIAFDSYMENQRGFTKTINGWIVDRRRASTQ